MTASICDSVSDALHLSLLSDCKKKPDLLNNCLIASARSLQLNKIEFEETGSHQVTNYEFLKSRNVIILSPNNASDTCDQDKQLKDDSGPSHTAGCSSSSKNGGLPQPKRILYPLMSVRLGWDSGWQVGSGMHNMGNTCYLNSTLQALFHVPAFANWLLSETHITNDCKCECVTCGMKRTLTETQNSASVIRPWRVYSKLRDICSYFTPMNQEDAHEFLRYLINAMVKSYLRKAGISEKEMDSYSKETTPLHQILGGYLRSAVRCLTCGHVSITYQHFQDLLVDARNANTLDEALKSFFSRETLDDCGYKCEACNKKVSATKQFFIERPPMVLCIALKRFSLTGGKLSKRVHYKTKICIKNYLTHKPNNPPSLTYRLVSVVNHIGNSQDSGHYTALGLGPGGNYYLFDDSSVWPVTPNNIVSANAYILFYELEKSDSIVLQGLSSPFKSAYKKKHDEVMIQKSNNINDKLKKHKLKLDGTLDVNNGLTLSPPSSKESSPNSSLSSDSNENNNIGNHKPILKTKMKVILNSPESIPSTSLDNKTITLYNRNNNNGYGESKKYDFVNSTSSSSRSTEQKQYSPSKSFTSNRNGNTSENGYKNDINGFNKNYKKIDEKDNYRNENGPQKSETKNLDDRNGCDKDEYSRSSSPRSQIKPIKFVKTVGKISGSGECSSDKEDYKKRDKLLALSQKSIVIKKDSTKATVQGWEVSNEVPVSLPSPSRNGLVNSRLTDWNDVDSHSQNHNGNHHGKSDYSHKNGNSKSSSSSTASNTSASNGNTSDKRDVVSQLMRQSHSGYGAPVNSWNGTHSQLDRQVYEDKKNQKKRAADADDEMDRGRQKKIRRHNNNYYSNSSTNSYQEVQNHRISWNANNRHDSNYQHYNGPHRQNFHYKRFNRGGNHYNNHRGNHFNHRGSQFHHRNQFRRNC